ncbi:MAG: hypothetical protein E2P04_03765 [Acidobacteria bacterium]|nr:MAG: hypothetical protein E2P04_03765 [Acidobacteriota bacterium]
MSQESEATTQDPVQPEEADAPEGSSKAQEMFLGKLKITDGKTVSFFQWTVVGAGSRWAYSAMMPLGNNKNHHIVMGHDANGNFLREAYSDTKDEAMSAVRGRILAFLKRQPRWRILE